MHITATARHLRHAIGTAVREGRHAIGWSQGELAARAGVSPGMVARVELGLVNVSVDRAGALLAALGLAIRLEIERPFVDRRQRDAAHARCVGTVRRRLGGHGWLTAGEVEIVDGRSRGFIDVLAFEPEAGVLLVSEVKTEIDDLGRIGRTLAWYVRAAWSAAARLGWKARRVERCVLVLATEANEVWLGENRVALAESFPARAGDLRALVSDGRPRRGAGLALIDPRSRRRGWPMFCRVDGRRTAAPYADYADAVRHWTSR